MNRARLSGCTLAIPDVNGRTIVLYCTDVSIGGRLGRSLGTHIVKMPERVTLKIEADAQAAEAFDALRAAQRTRVSEPVHYDPPRRAA